MSASLAQRIAFKSRLLLAPANRQRWKARYLFPVRNAVTFRKTFSLHAGGLSCLLHPEGQLAAEIWSQPAAIEREAALLLKVLAPSMTFLDVGAGLGVFSIFVAQALTQGSAYAVESASPAYEQLCDNLRLNSARNIVSYRLELAQPSPQNSAEPSNIDDLLRAAGVLKVDVLRLRAHGAELFAVRGGQELLRRPDAPLLLYSSLAAETSSFGYHPVELFWFLEPMGFTFFTFDAVTGAIAAASPPRAYDATMIAVKAAHPSYARIRELAR